eukprot:TRINITY_DN56139_c0_g1_i1.p1 TRINITY_DN56139_c0_g1~~TRINITY_DN56139_c0_g1_i1.p1  ORF type:complete len:454 (+),score=62.75 TRINITY_DN56139_c0_g1_i1:105-1466(+)
MQELTQLDQIDTFLEKRGWLFTNVNIADGVLHIGRTAQIEGPDSFDKARILMGYLCRKFTIHSVERMKEPALLGILRGIFLVGFQETQIGRQLLEVVLNQVDRKIHLFAPPGLAEVAQVMADSNFRHEGILDKIIQHGSWKAADFDQESAAKLIRNMTKLESTNFELFNQIINTQLEKLSKYNAENIAWLMWGAGECGIYKEALLEKVSRYTKKCGMQLFGMTPQAALFILRGFACLHYVDETALKYLSNYLNKNSPQDIMLCVGVMNAWATLGQRVEQIVGVLENFNAAFESQGMEGFNEESLSELYNALLLFRAKGQKMAIGDEINSAAFKAWQKETQLGEMDELETQIMSEVCSILDKQGAKYSKNFYNEEIVIPIDIVIEENGTKKGINVAGKTQYTCTRPYRPTGGLVSTQWVYEKQGWKVFTIPFYDWQQIKTDEEKQEYLKQLLSE